MQQKVGYIMLKEGDGKTSIHGGVCFPYYNQGACPSYVSLLVFLIDGPKQNATSLLTPVSNTVFMLFQVVPSVLLSMVALITTYMKESDWLLKDFHQSENGLQSYHGEQNRGYYLKEHKKL